MKPKQVLILNKQFKPELEELQIKIDAGESAYMMANFYFENDNYWWSYQFKQKSTPIYELSNDGIKVTVPELVSAYINDTKMQV